MRSCTIGKRKRKRRRASHFRLTGSRRARQAARLKREAVHKSEEASDDNDKVNDDDDIDDDSDYYHQIVGKRPGVWGGI